MAINYQKAQFIASYGTIDQLPKPNAPEIALAGRSNVGKSSLLNGLVGRKALAKVSSQPGKTANINFILRIAYLKHLPTNERIAILPEPISSRSLTTSEMR